ncbi:hypothetical protein PoB_003815500 [Plakobranchus ocellatus]|uniref:Uncharacterized protein n=1 Tax=Plakobranchus ocellatus TaxID=259542 RepID=A0AAV4ATJ2_9GAST|nr:hypothetical protein PoB_003815500 [Plakobranchus ocellatus]
MQDMTMAAVPMPGVFLGRASRNPQPTPPQMPPRCHHRYGKTAPSFPARPPLQPQAHAPPTVGGALPLIAREAPPPRLAVPLRRDAETSITTRRPAPSKPRDTCVVFTTGYRRLADIARISPPDIATRCGLVR